MPAPTTTPSKPRILINLPPTFFTRPELKSHFQRFSRLGKLTKTSHNTQDEILKDLPKADAVVMWAWPNLDDAVLDQCPQLKFVGQINTSGVTARTCLARKIALTEVRHCWSPAVAEMALTLILAGLRKTSVFHRQMREGTEPWVNEFPAEIDATERELSGRNIGIVGFGGIGQRLAKLLAPFEGTLRIYDPFVPATVARHLGAEQVPLKDLLKKSEVIVLCAANTEGARHLLGPKEIALIPKQAVLVNVGRSMLIDMDALQARVQQGDLTVLLDVFEKEPLSPSDPVRQWPNTFLTPHRAGGLIASVQRALTMIADDLEAHLTKKKRKFPVTPAMLNCFP